MKFLFLGKFKKMRVHTKEKVEKGAKKLEYFPQRKSLWDKNMKFV